MDIARAGWKKTTKNCGRSSSNTRPLMGLPARVILRIHFSFRATEQGFSSWKTNCQLATEDSDCRFGHLKALTVDGALAVRWLFEIDAANASVDAGGGTPAGCCCREGASR